MRQILFIIMLVAVLASGDVMAFNAKKTMDRPNRPAFKKTATLKESDDPVASTPPSGGPSLAFATASPATTSGGAYASSSDATMSVAHANQDELDEDVIIGFGTVFVSCALSLVLGFSLGYGT